MGRSRSYISSLWNAIKGKIHKIFWPATDGHFALVMPGRHFFTVFCFMLFSIGVTRSQSPVNREAVDNQNIIPLNIGDQIPDELWNLPLQVVNHPDGKETITLREYKDKLIILDFWATWCVPCITSMPKLDALQKEFSKEIVVVPVTAELGEKVIPFMKKQGWQMPSIIDNKSIDPFFPHSSIPHQVWINNEKLLAEVGAESAKRENILAAINNQKLGVIIKKEDLNFELDKPLFYNGNGGDLKDIKIRSTIAPRLNAQVGGIKRRPNGFLFYNVLALNLIYESVSNSIPYHGRFNRIIWDVSDSLKVDITGEGKNRTGDFEQDVEFSKWLKKNTYCYELAVSPELNLNRQEMLSIMRMEIQKFFNIAKGIEFKIEARKVAAYSIIETGKNKNSGSLISPDDSNKYFTLVNQPIEKLYMYVSAVLAKQKYPFVDFSPSSNLVTIQIDKSDLTAEGIRSQLKKFGFDLTISDHEVKMLVISNLNKKD